MKSDMTSRQQNSVMSKFKVATISAVITSLICGSIPNTYASDIEIYKVPEDSVGTTTLMFMLDVSGSMSRGDYGQTGSRLNRLKQGMRDVLYGSGVSEPLANKIIIGLGVFEGNNGRINTIAKALGQEGSTNVTNQKEIYYQLSRNNSTYYSTCTDWHSLTQSCKAWSKETTTNPGVGNNYYTYTCYFGESCRVYYTNGTVRKRTHRDDLMASIDNLQPLGNTPTPYAYATAAAYLMGQQISEPNKQWYFKRSFNDNYAVCIKWNGENCESWAGWYYGNFDTNQQGITQGASGELDYKSGRYYVGTGPFSGFEPSISESKDGDKFKAIKSITDQATNNNKKECSGQGLYFLTDAVHVVNSHNSGSDGTTGVPHQLMKTSLGAKGADFNCLSSPLGDISTNDNNGRIWACIGKYAQALLDQNKNPTGLQIKTAVVGFGEEFTNSNGSIDVENAKKWGEVGGGGWTAGNNSKDIVDSVNAFLKELIKDIPSMSTGSSTIPLDALNPAVVQPYAYFPQFEPKVKPEDTKQIWFGNLKKYYVLNNGVYSSKTVADDSTVVVKQSKLQDLNDIWNNTNISYPDGVAIFKKGGVLNRLLLGTTTTADGKIETGRKLLTDYAYDGTLAANERVKKDLNLVQVKHTYTIDNKTKTDTTYARALMGLLGYVISNDTNTEGLDLSNQAATLRQMGSVSHSKPLLITQSGKAEATKVGGKVVIDTTNRDDYVLFGTTQGSVQVVNANTGVEKFAFVPKEIIENQSETFKQDGGNLAAGKDALYYGMDGEWTAHTAYVSKSDGTLTVGSATRNVLESTNNEVESLTGKQWAYGGMRMGGRSYYALDLTDIDKPKIKFHIDPSTGTVYSQAKPAGTTYAALQKMGQSWSKPSLGYVNWKGQRKLVMIVGGGYDAGGDDGDGLKANGIRTGYKGYETYNYDQTNEIGAGVYMFDADTGDLLWNADSTSNASLKYSVVSQIRTVDRNNDGIIDHLYFGDLAGQTFRADFKNDGDKTEFKTQTTKMLDLHKSDGTSPRFYTLPVFTAHNSAGSTTMFGGNTVVVTFVSGNQSSPLLATSDSPQKKDPTGLQFDGVYAIFDYDVYPSTSEGRYPTSHIGARTLDSVPVNDTAMDKTKLRYINGATTATAINKDTGWGGWYYQFDTKIDGTTKKGASVIKGLTTPIAMEGSLYVTQFDASDNGTTSSCGAGVKGHSFSQRFCLPSGVCQGGAIYIYNLGSGIVTLNVGSASDPNQRSLVVPDPNDICPAGKTCTPNGEPKFITTGGSLRLIPNRWYEKYTQ